MTNYNQQMITCDGNEAAAYVAYRVSEVCAIYPITPSSTMAELADEWAAQQTKNIWGNVPHIAEMQSEAGAAGAVHGALQSGAMTTTFTASQGLMLMLPNMYKIAGELTSCVFHVAARSLATSSLSIFGDHQDVMAARSTGFAQLSSSSVQEAHDMALVAHASTLDSRIPFIHFFDGFRTSHEVNKLTLIDDEIIREMIDDELVRAHRERALSPDRDIMRGTAQNPDVYFQAREAVNKYYDATPEIVARNMKKLGQLTGRNYKLIEYYGAEDAEKVIVCMGSGVETIKETLVDLNANGEKVGCVQVRLFRPLSSEAILDALPKTAKKIAVLDRTKEAGSNGEPLYQDILTIVMENQDRFEHMPRIIGGRYGLSSKEFTPAMVKGIYDELAKKMPKQHFTVGIVDDVTNTSIDYDESYDIEPQEVVRAMFYGLGSDGTVGANKNTIKIIGGEPDYYAQGYFVYDSKKSGSQTVSHLRFGKYPIDSPYLIQSANFIACHQESFLDTTDMLEKATKGATFLVNSHYSKDEIWDHFPARMQQQIIDKEMKVYVIDAFKVARESGMGNRINTVMQTCFFELSGVQEPEVAIKGIKKAIKKTYMKKGADVVQKNFDAVDQSIANLYQVEIPQTVTSAKGEFKVVPDEAPDFVKNVTAKMMAGQGDRIPVSLIPDDGTYPTSTTKWEKRNIAQFLPVWDPDLCVQCGNCSMVCPHTAIRAKFYDKSELEGAPQNFKSANTQARGFPDTGYTIQIYADDCTGCGLCADACPITDMEDEKYKALNMRPKQESYDNMVADLEHFETIPYNDRARVDFSNVRGVQFLQPLFEFSGACSGCGETPYVSMMTRLFGDRLMVANATGCSSIYGGNLPTTPWAHNADGRGPAWSNSLFEDNAEFGFGFRLAETKHNQLAQELLQDMKPQLDGELVDNLLSREQRTESNIQAQIKDVDRLKEKLSAMDSEESKHLASIAEHLIRRSIWILGGDGWAYDIGYGGVDHVLASGEDVNIMVMDTEVYSNTGGQMSKSTPHGAIAKFAASGKKSNKKDLAMQAISYGNVYVARIALGADPEQALRAMREAEAYPGPSLIIAYSHCIAHGIRMEQGLTQQKLAVKSGHWPLFRYNPTLRDIDQIPFQLDSLRPSVPLFEYRDNEVRYKRLHQTHPELVDQVYEEAEEALQRRWNVYEELATTKVNVFNV